MKTELLSKESPEKIENENEQIQANLVQKEVVHGDMKASKQILHDASQLLPSIDIPPTNESLSVSKDNEKEDSEDELDINRALLFILRNSPEIPRTNISARNKCDLCEISFHNKLRLKSHFKYLHDKVPCKNCDRSFVGTKGLKRHRNSNKFEMCKDIIKAFGTIDELQFNIIHE